MTLQSARNAAIDFARLGARDRDWILKRLSADERARFLALVALPETRPSLDGEEGTSAFSATLHREAELARGSHGKQVNQAEGLGALATANTGLLVQILRGESDFLVAALVFCRPWPWRALLLERLGAERRSRISRLEASAMRVRPAVAATLIEAVLARLAEHRLGVANSGIEDASGASPAPPRRNLFGLSRWKA